MDKNYNNIIQKLDFDAKQWRDRKEMYKLVRKSSGKTEVLKDTLIQKDKVFTELDEAKTLADKLNSILRDQRLWDVRKF